MELTQDVTIRRAMPADLTALDALFARSYPQLLKDFYPPSVLVTAMPIIARAQPELLASGTYYVAFAQGAIVGAGGFSWRGAQGGATPITMAHIRHVVTCADHVRRGIGRRLVNHAMSVAQGSGARVMRASSTRMAVPFYESLGFYCLGEVDVQLRPGISFPAVEMQCLLA